MLSNTCVFLDLDGVIRLRDPESGLELYKRPCVARLNRVLRKTGAHVVIISNWRKRLSPLTMHVVLVDMGVENLSPPDQLCVRGDLCRGDAITDWLAQHPNIQKWAVIDDELRHYDRWVRPRQAHVFCPNGREGIQDNTAARLTAFLLGRPEPETMQTCADAAL